MTKRYCICVFWEKDGIVRDYFSYYLKGLQEVAEKILVVVNGKISEDSRKLLSDMGINILVRENKGLDFWAYKAGIETAGYEELSKYDELILTNCTCYGPIRPFSEMFEEMEKRDCDFWGITKHPEYPSYCINNKKKIKLFEHIQSYFIVFKNSMFTSKDFKNYWKHLKKVRTFKEAVAYNEISFTKYFTEKGFKDASYIDLKLHEKLADNPMFVTYKLLEKGLLPVVKRKAICGEFNVLFQIQLRSQSAQIIKFLEDNTNYDTKMIYQDLLATKTMSEIKAHLNLNYVLSSEFSDKVQTNDKKIALIMHICYEDLIDYCLKYAQSMPDGTDIYFVSSKKSVLDICKEKENLLSNYNVFYRQKNNRGRDVSAYLVTCSDAFENYDYICCMHDDKEASTAEFSIIGEEFSYHCFECNLKSKNYVQNILKTFETKPEIGMFCPPAPEFGPYRKIGKELMACPKIFIKLMKNLDLHIPFDAHPVAPFGSMFWVRGKAIAPLFRHKWQYEDFPPEPLPKDGTLSHAIERIYPAIAQEAGYLTGWIMPEDYAQNYINNLHFCLLQEKCRPQKLSTLKKIFSITNVNIKGIKHKQMYILGKKLLIKHNGY